MTAWRRRQYASSSWPRTSASAARLFMYMASTVSCEIGRVKNPSLTAGMKSIV